MKLLVLTIIALTYSVLSFSQSSHPKFKECLKKSPDKMTAFCLKNENGLVDFLLKENIKIKYRTSSWLFITATPSWINDNQSNGNIKQFYFETGPPQLLSDTIRLSRYVEPVHQGLGGLAQPYTGEGVVIGVIDTGVDFNHPDFKFANGKTRVMRIWDHTDNSGLNTYTEYGMGRLWDSTYINNGTCTYLPTNKHGTQVTGVAAGNGLANGKNKGMAPDSKIVMVVTDLNATNWTLTVADACDYIYKFADSLGLPAVINLSAGGYFGSHDGNDPATLAVEQMLDAKGGRILVTAAGNGGAASSGKFHLGGNVTADTTFVWFNNHYVAGPPSTNTVYFDLWADTADAHFDFAFGADKPAPSYGFRGRTSFRNARDNLGVVVYDTIYNGSNKIASMQIWTEIIDSAFHLEFFMEDVDSTTYKYRFMTKGTGKYDLWSGAWLGANDMELTLPSAAIVPEIVNYQMPDTLQTMVSSFQCSEKVISVANCRNRLTYTNKNGTISTPTPNPVGNITNSSSRGPNRLRLQKPDVTCNGDITFSASTLAYLGNPANNNNILTGGWHSKMTGTSIASPVVAGIAALYLQKCPNASYLDFKHDLIATSTTDMYTGTVPNYTYGFGKPHALNLLLGPNNIPILGDPTICLDPVTLTTDTYSSVDSVVWNTGLNAASITTSVANVYSASIYYGEGCVAHSNSVNVIQGLILPSPIISNMGAILMSDVQTNYQWTLNGLEILGEISQTLSAVPPYGSYNVKSVSVDGCVSISNSLDLTSGLSAEVIKGISISPNPTTSDFSIKLDDQLISISATDVNGKEVNLIEKGNDTFSLYHLRSGSYYLKIVTDKGLFRSKIIKM